MRRLVVKPFGKALYRGPGEFDKSSKGVHSSAISNFYPYPSTVAGILSWMRSRRADVGGETAHSDWVSEYSEMLGSDAVIYGPFYKGRGGTYVVYDLRSRKLIRTHLDRVNKYNVKYRFGEPGEIDLSHYTEEEGYISISRDSFFQDRIGINLDRNGNNKTVEEGGLYTVQFFFPEKISRDIEIVYYIDNIEIEELINISRFGGEGGVAGVTVSNDAEIDRIFDLDFSRDIGLYILSPLLIPTYRDVRRYVGDYLSSKGFRLRRIVGETTLLGAGYSTIPTKDSKGQPVGIRKSMRRPIYHALKPGTVIYVDADGDLDSDSLKSLCIEGLGVGREVGYGKLLPFKPIKQGD